MESLLLASQWQFLVKFSFSEKATKIWSYHPLDLTFIKPNVKSTGDNFKFLWPSQMSWTLKMVRSIKESEEGVKNYLFQTTLFMDGHLAREAFIGDESIGLWCRHNSLIQGVPLSIKVTLKSLSQFFVKVTLLIVYLSFWYNQFDGKKHTKLLDWLATIEKKCSINLNFDFRK